MALTRVGSDTSARDRMLLTVLGPCDASVLVNDVEYRCQRYTGHDDWHIHYTKEVLTVSWSPTAHNEDPGTPA